MTTKTTKQETTLQTRQDNMAKARLARKEKPKQDISKAMFLTIPQIMEMYGLSRSDTLDLIEVSEKKIKSKVSGKKVKFLAIDIKEMMSAYQ